MVPSSHSASSDDPLYEELIGSERLYDGHIVGLRRDSLRLRDGHEVTREVVEHGHAVVVLAIVADGLIAFVRQWRVPVSGSLLELPAGGVDAGESPEEAAERELQEEVGLRPGSLERVAGFWVAPGWATEYLHAYIARDCVQSSLPADGDERIEVQWHSLGKALALVEEGVIEDAKSIILLQALALKAAGPLVTKIVQHYRGE